MSGVPVKALPPPFGLGEPETKLQPGFIWGAALDSGNSRDRPVIGHITNAFDMKRFGQSRNVVTVRDDQVVSTVEGPPVGT
jgi:hypothetical protein